MPSPFPGVDPYLEGSIWPTVHVQLSSEIARQLTPKLAPKYVTLATEWHVLDADEGRLDTVIPVKVRRISIEIRDVARHRLVTAIEVLSPSNKRSPGRRVYLAKRRHLLLSRAHLMEIDLLRRGRRVPMRESLPDAPYFVLLSRAQERPATEVWPIGLRERLPIVPLPLLPGDADVPLDLQAAFEAIYDAFRFDLAVDYTEPPRISLPPEESNWVEQMLSRRA